MARCRLCVSVLGTELLGSPFAMEVVEDDERLSSAHTAHGISAETQTEEDGTLKTEANGGGKMDLLKAAVAFARPKGEKERISY